MIDLSLEKIWQEEENSIWYTNIKPVCNVCGKEVKTAIEIKTNMTSLPIRLCLDPNRGCMQYSINFYFTKSKTLNNTVII